MKLIDKIKQKFNNKEKEYIVEPWSEIAATVEAIDIDYVVDSKAQINGSMLSTKLFANSSKMIDEYLTQDSLNLFINAPLFLRINFILHAINLTNAKKNSVNWNKVTNFLYANQIPFDYNINLPRVINSATDLSKLNSRIYMALKDIDPYHKALCKSCNEVFYLKYGELKFYVEKDLYITKKCLRCRK